MKVYSERVKKGQDEADAITKGIWETIEKEQKANTTPVNFAMYMGTYHDAWFGDVVISLKNGKQWFQSLRSPKLTGELFYYKNNTFIVKWTNRSFDADAYVTFQTDENQKPASINMKPISPLTDFSFDFQDLDLKRVSTEASTKQ
ncbi:DUF3471 domain-containing protein [Spirosoma telluris]|uniref:DUF3471 domain-containing protein n=1 Tax=Spirosoma telluris TaxID=2183553 RepID=UPI002FC38EDD